MRSSEEAMLESESATVSRLTFCPEAPSDTAIASRNVFPLPFSISFSNNASVFALINRPSKVKVSRHDWRLLVKADGFLAVLDPFLEATQKVLL